MPQLSEAAELLRQHCAEDRGADALYLPRWTAADWADLLAQAHRTALARNEVLIKPGQAERLLYLVASGRVTVNAGGGGGSMGHLSSEGPGAVIGEIAFFDGGKRSATVWAIEPTELLALGREDVEAFAERNPARGRELLFALGRVLAFRIRRAEHRRQADAF